jgi:flagellar hook-associated protein FlgK
MEASMSLKRETIIAECINKCQDMMRESLQKHEDSLERKLQDFGEDWSSNASSTGESSLSIESTSHLVKTFNELSKKVSGIQLKVSKFSSQSTAPLQYS